MASWEFDIDRAVEFINTNKYSKVGLQFPTEILPYSIGLYDEFCKRTQASIVILADTPYSSCCVDELAGKRWGVEAVIHFGNACLTPCTGTVGVYHVFGNVSCSEIVNNLEEISNQLKQQTASQDDTILVVYDFQYRYTAKVLSERLQSKGLDVIFSEPALPGYDQQSFIRHAGRIFKFNHGSKPPSYLLYLGDSESTLYSILVSMNGAYRIKALTVNPSSGQVLPASKSALSFLRRRYYLMEKVKSAKRVGILMGTLSVARYRDMVARLKRLLQRAKKPYTTVVVGRINEAKLINLPDLDSLVLVACPQASVFDDPNLLLPVVTPYELECALHDLCREEEEEQEGCDQHPRRWSGLWLPLDFVEDILNPEAPTFAPEDAVVPPTFADNDGESKANEEKGTLVERDAANWSLALACGDLLAGTRDSWRGLDLSLGQTPPLTTVAPGRSGVPTSYKRVEEEEL